MMMMMMQKYWCVVSTNSNHMHLLRDDRMILKIKDLVEQTAVPFINGKLRYGFQTGAH